MQRKSVFTPQLRLSLGLHGLLHNKNRLSDEGLTLLEKNYWRYGWIYLHLHVIGAICFVNSVQKYSKYHMQDNCKL